MVPTDSSGACAHVPIRTCVGCRQRAPKQELLRLVAHGSGNGLTVVPDPQGGAPGRGAHLHPSLDCLELALRRRALTRALRLSAGAASEPVRDYMEQQAQKRR